MSRAKKKKNFNHKSNENVVEFNRFRKSKTAIKLLPRNLEQETYLEKLEDPNLQIVTAYGIAGSGKTYLACGYAANQLLNGFIDKIVFVRPNVALGGEGIGHLPGDMLEKMKPWIAPLIDALQEQGYGKQELEAMLKDDIIEVVPVAYIRGRSFKNACIIADECQNLTGDGMLSLLTRIGENSKMVIVGDTQQSDRSQKNGLTKMIDRCEQIESMGFVELIKSERNPVIEEVIQAFA